MVRDYSESARIAANYAFCSELVAYATATIMDEKGNVVPSCIVSEHTYVSTDPVYGPTGLTLLKADTLFIIPRDALGPSQYTANLSRPGQEDISWSFNVAGSGLIASNFDGNGNNMVFANEAPEQVEGDTENEQVRGR